MNDVQLTNNPKVFKGSLLWKTPHLNFLEILSFCYTSGSQPFLVHGPSFKKNIQWTTLLCWHLMNN